jgi:3-aminobutyryl-CoA ammonia-lyase
MTANMQLNMTPHKKEYNFFRTTKMNAKIIILHFGFNKNIMEKITSLIRLRMGSHDAHYGGNLVDGAKMLQLFGDVATELLIRCDGDEGLFKAYDMVEFLAPVYAGDYIEAVGEITQMGNTSRKMVFEARKVIVPRPDINASAADVLAEPIIVCKASGTCVVPKEFKRK